MPLHKTIHKKVTPLYTVFVRCLFSYDCFLCIHDLSHHCINCTISRIPIIWVLCFRDSINQTVLFFERFMNMYESRPEFTNDYFDLTF